MVTEEGTAEAAWKDERNAHTKAHLAKARANRADAVASRQKAKELRDEIVTSRQVVANAARKQQQSNKEAKEKTVMFSAGGIRIGEAAKKIWSGEAAKTLGHATSGPALQQNLVCTMEGRA